MRRPWRRHAWLPGEASQPGFPFRWCLDAPAADWRHVVPLVEFRGWIAVPADASVDGPYLHCGERVRLRTRERLDIARVMPRERVIGFEQLVSLDPASAAQGWALELVVDGVAYTRPLPIAYSEADDQAFHARKRSKLAAVEPLLRCPRPLDDATSCLGELERSGDEELRCVVCDARYGRREHAFDLLTGELRAAAGVDPTENVSSWGYDPLADSVIADVDGLVLDNGSGCKNVYLDRVVNLEIVDYPTTDVLAVGERLPFADGAFAGALSLAVLEHVRDPFRCAREIARVVRPGGRIYVAVPFLQPYHGYPHHYFNMTLQALEQLFHDTFAIEQAGTPPYGWPIWTLSWFLNRYVDGLPPDTAARFREMTVSDLLQPPSNVLADDFVQDLEPDAVAELASVNYLIATRR